MKEGLFPALFLEMWYIPYFSSDLGQFLYNWKPNAVYLSFNTDVLVTYPQPFHVLVVHSAFCHKLTSMKSNWQCVDQELYVGASMT